MLELKEDSQPTTILHSCPAPFDEAVLDLVPSAIFILDSNGTVLHYNRYAEQFCGPGLATGKPLRFASPDGRGFGNDALFAEMLRSGQPQRNVELVVEGQNGKRLLVVANVDPCRNAEGAVSGAIVCLQEVQSQNSGQHPSTEPLATSTEDAERHLRKLLDALPTAIYTTDQAGLLTYFNQACVELAGRVPEIGTDEWCVTWRLYWPDGTPLPHDECPMALALKQTRPFHGVEALAERPDGVRIPFLAYPAPLYDSTGQLNGAVNMLVEISERKRADSYRQSLINELNHRVKNTLTTVQSIAAQSFRREAGNQDYQGFEGRLIALSRAHNILSRESWDSADLQDIVQQVMAPFRDSDGRRVSVEGSRQQLRPKVAISLTMALHELCTNAARHGALSNDCGHVRIAWNVFEREGKSSLALHWKETAGPAVTQPLSKGFGSRLLERGLVGELNAKVRLDYLDSGLVCAMDVPLP